MPQSLLDLKHSLAEILVRSGLDYRSDIRFLETFLMDRRWQEEKTPSDVAGVWREHIKELSKKEHQFSIYMHIPYCAEKCSFCYCSMQVSKNSALIDKYISALKQEIEFFSPLLKGVPLVILYVGGGTPNLLSVAQLQELLKCAATNFKLKKDGVHTIEFNPASTDKQKLSVARSYGLNRVSFGVQSLNSYALEKENREYQTYEMTRDSIRWAQEAGFDFINADLIMGLAYDNLDGFLDSFRKIAGLGPTSIEVQRLALTDSYVKTMKLTAEANLRRYEAFLPRALEGMRKICEEYDYDMTDIMPNRSIVYRRDPTRNPFLEEMRGGVMPREVSTLGLGYYAKSSLYGHTFYKRYAKPFYPHKPLYSMATINLKEEMMRYVIYELWKWSRIDLVAFKKSFGCEFSSVFGLELRLLKVFGKIKEEKNRVLFLPASGRERMFYGMFFLLDALSKPPWSQSARGILWRKNLERDVSGASPLERVAV